jgi:hypothetical protein
MLSKHTALKPAKQAFPVLATCYGRHKGPNYAGQFGVCGPGRQVGIGPGLSNVGVWAGITPWVDKKSAPKVSMLRNIFFIIFSFSLIVKRFELAKFHGQPRIHHKP